MVDAPDYKACSKCEALKPLSDYYENRRYKGGHYKHCKACHGAITKARRDRRRALQPPRPTQVPPTEKKCGECGETQPLGNFYKPPSSNSYWRYCKPCMAIRSKREYERSRETWVRRAVANRRQKLLIKGGREAEPTECECCGASPDSYRNGKHQNGKYKGLAFDHDHATGEFRGWLCGHCNRALGLMDDNPELILKLALYLERHREKAVPRTEAPSLRIVSEQGHRNPVATTP